MILKTKPIGKNFIQIEFPAELLEEIGVSVGDELEIHGFDKYLVMFSAKKSLQERK